MTKIHGIAYILVGLGIAIQAYFIDFDKLYVFFWVGLGLMAYGIGKLVFWYITREGEEEKPEPAAIRAEPHATAPKHPAAQHPIHPRPAHPRHMEFCPYCGAPILPHHVYCAKCGRKIE